MTLQVSALVDLAEDGVVVPEPTWWFTTIDNTNSKGCNVLF